MITLICKCCGISILTFPSRQDRKKYCSKKCQYLYRKGSKSSLETRKKQSEATKKEGYSNTGRFKKGQNVGVNHPNWKNGTTISQNKYVMMYSPLHPSSKNGNKHIKRSRLTVEKHIGRYLRSSEIVHHIDCDTFNDSPENLYLCNSIKEHKWAHKQINLKSNIIKYQF